MRCTEHEILDFQHQLNVNTGLTLASSATHTSLGQMEVVYVENMPPHASASAGGVLSPAPVPFVSSISFGSLHDSPVVYLPSAT